MAIVYLATNVVNGKRYVGATVYPLKKRMKEHICAARRGSPYPLHRAIDKYGAEKIVWSVVQTYPDRESLMEGEIRHIDNLHPEYNATIGGRGIVGCARTPEWTEKIAEKLRGRKIPEETILRMKASNGWVKNYKSVVCLETGEVFESQTAAAAAFGVAKHFISAVINGEWMTAAGHHFIRCTEPMDEEQRRARISEIEKRRELFESRRGLNRSRSVLCVDTCVVYPSCWAANLVFNPLAKNGSTIIAACRGKIKSAYGHTWRYADEVK